MSEAANERYFHESRRHVQFSASTTDRHRGSSFPLQAFSAKDSIEKYVLAVKRKRCRLSYSRSDLPLHIAVPNNLGEDLVPCAQPRRAELFVLVIDEEEIITRADGAGADDLCRVLAVVMDSVHRCGCRPADGKAG